MLDDSADAAKSTRPNVNGADLEAEALPRAWAARTESDDALRSALVHVVAIGGTVQGLPLYTRPQTWNSMVADGPKLEALVREMVAFAGRLDAHGPQEPRYGAVSSVFDQKLLEK